jgi:hypothetical protein
MDSEAVPEQGEGAGHGEGTPADVPPAEVTEPTEPTPGQEEEESAEEESEEEEEEEAEIDSD